MTVQLQSRFSGADRASVNALLRLTRSVPSRGRVMRSPSLLRKRRRSAIKYGKPGPISMSLPERKKVQWTGIKLRGCIWFTIVPSEAVVVSTPATSGSTPPEIHQP
ncbi:hypothetical protein VTI28DRAFT_3960 [Corynascus sepedonium]